MLLTSISYKAPTTEEIVTQNEILQTVADTAAVGLLMIDEHQHCIFMNRSAEKITGYTLNELQNQQFAAFVLTADEHYPDGKCPVFNTLQHTISEQGETTWIHKDGHPYHFAFTASPVIKNRGNTGIVVEIKIIEGDKNAAKPSSTQTEERFHYLANQSPMIMFVMAPGAKATLSFLNTVFLAYIGQSATSAWSDIVHADDLQVLNDACIPALQQHTAYTTPAIRLRRYDGQYRWHILKGNPRYLPNGEFIGIVGLGFDIHEQKQNEQILRQSEERFRTLAETLPQLVWITDANGKQEFASKRWEAYTGIQPADERTWASVAHSEDIENIGRAWSYSLKTGEPYKVEVRLLHKTGEYRWNHVQGEPVRIDNGDIIKWIGAFTDIQDQKKAEETIRHSEERFRNIANEAPVMLWMTNAAIQSVFFNKSWLDFTGISLENQLGKPSPVEVHPDDYECRMNTFLTAFETQKKYEHQFRLKRYDGEYRWVRSIGIPRFSAEGIFEGFIGSTIDIHDTVLQQQRKDSFIQMASHELKTPVTTLKAYTQLLLEMQQGSTDTILMASLEAADKQVVKITRLIEDILNLTRMERNSLDINKKVFFINDLARETVADLQKTFLHHRIIIEEHETAAVLADRDRIEQVLINFITNAAKYSPKANSITVRITACMGEVSVEVEDFGIGIAQKDHSNIFDKFYRVEGKDESTFPGFGIGLYIAKEFIKLHNGKIGLTSEKDKGSRFYFTLPVNA